MEGAIQNDGREDSRKDDAARAPQTLFTTTDATLPFVSVVIPCYNEERFIGEVLENLAKQYDSRHYEIIVVDGMSDDCTREIVAQFKSSHPDIKIRLIDNHARSIPVALNIGIKAARGDIIVRMDAHSIASNNYVRRCVEVLKRGDVDVVGMPWRIRAGAETLTAQAIALAVSHPFGIGDAKYRLMDSLCSEQIVDTVPFGAFRKELWYELGGFNEDLLTNEDYDFNYRARLRGGRVLLDPAAHCDYFARATIKDLARQYARYGSWKAQMIKRHPRSVRWRHIIAPVFVAYLIVTSVSGLFWSPAQRGLLFAIGLYVLLALLCAVSLSRKVNEFRLVFLLPIIFFVLHFVWGGSFLLGLFRRPYRLSATEHSRKAIGGS